MQGIIFGLLTHSSNFLFFSSLNPLDLGVIVGKVNDFGVTHTTNEGPIGMYFTYFRRIPTKIMYT